MSHAATCMMNDELTEPEALTHLQSLSIADLVGLLRFLETKMMDNNYSYGTLYDIQDNFAELKTELNNRYSALFPNNKHFTI